MLQTELCQERGGKVGLVHDLLNRHLLAHGTARPDHRYAEEARTEPLALLRIRYAVVGQQDDKRVLPLFGLAEASYKLANAMVGVGKGVEMGIFKLLVRHLKRLMAAQREERCEPRFLAVLALLEHVVEMVEGYAVGHTPLAVVALGQ